VPDRPAVQAQEVSYELHTLGWKAFQDLCLAVADEVLGRPIHQFLHSRDADRDGAFYATRIGAAQQPESYAVTIQCKHTSRKDQTLSVARLSDELAKASALSVRPGRT
jgi:hypothetical protein